MRESSSAAQAWVRFCEGVSEGKVDQFDEIVSQGDVDHRYRAR
jgi:hypothetical protein